jgi:hypothetical protein
VGGGPGLIHHAIQGSDTSPKIPDVDSVREGAISPAHYVPDGTGTPLQHLAGPHCIDTLCKTGRTIGMGEHAICRHRTMCFSIRSPGNPTLIIKGMSCVLSHGPAHATYGDHRRYSDRSGRRPLSSLIDHHFTGHSHSPFHHSSSTRFENSNKIPTPHGLHSAHVQRSMVLGNPLVHRVSEARLDYDVKGVLPYDRHRLTSRLVSAVVL